MVPHIETVPVVNGQAKCPDCGLVLKVIRDSRGIYRHTRKCSHIVAVLARDGKFEVDFVRSQDERGGE